MFSFTDFTSFKQKVKIDFTFTVAQPKPIIGKQN